MFTIINAILIFCDFLTYHEYTRNFFVCVILFHFSVRFTRIAILPRSMGQHRQFLPNDECIADTTTEVCDN